MPVELEWETARASASALAEAGAALGSAGFDERAVCAFYGVPIPSDAMLVSPPAGRVRRGLGALIALLVGGESVERRALPMLEGVPLHSLLDTGLLVLSGGVLSARASITPFRGALVAADRLDDHTAAAVRPPDLSAWNVAASLPPVLDSLLDTGCGAGAILLAAALRGARVRGTDVDERAIAFARISASLSGLFADSVSLEYADLQDGVPGDGAPFSCAVFNAPLVRAPLAVETPLYLFAPGAEVLPLRFLAAARALLSPGGEALCHTQLTDGIWSAVMASGFGEAVALQFATAPDGTPHALISLRQGGPATFARFRTPLGPALPHLSREPLDRLHQAAALVTADPASFAAATLRPAPWLALLRTAVHDGHGFRDRSLHLGANRLEPGDLGLLERCDGRAVGEAAGGSDGLARARALVSLGLLVP